MCDSNWFCNLFSVIVKFIIVILMYIFGRKCGFVRGVVMYNWKLLLYLILELLIIIIFWLFCVIVFLFKIGLSDGFKCLFKFCKIEKSVCNGNIDCMFVVFDLKFFYKGVI